MFESLIVIALSGSLGAFLWHRAIIENQQDLAQQIESQGGVNSPWLQPELRRKIEASPDFWATLDSKYSDAEKDQIERNPFASLPVSPLVSPPASAPSPVASQPVSMHEATTAPQPAVEPVAPTTSPTGCSPVVELTGCDWLTANKPFFPVAVPPAQVESFVDRQKLIQASAWIAKAVEAGISQNKIVTEVFGKSKGTAEYSRIVEIVKELKE